MPITAQLALLRLGHRATGPPCLARPVDKLLDRDSLVVESGLEIPLVD